MSDVTFLSPSRLATYADCPRKFDYNYVQEVEALDETRLYLNQGLAYHETIEDICEAAEPDDDPETIHDRAMDAFTTKWEEHLAPEEYASKAHQEYQRRENRAAIDSFFDPEGGDGIEHARNSIATEKWLECVYDGFGLRGRADNILLSEEELHIIDYKRTVKGVLGHWSGDRLIDHLEQENHEVDRVKNAFQTAAYIEGIKGSNLYEEGMSIRFSFYGLLHDRDTEGTSEGLHISVNGKPRETTTAYEEYHDTVWSLIAQAHQGITNEEHSPTPFSLIQEEACPECDYQAMCPDYLAEEVRQ